MYDDFNFFDANVQKKMRLTLANKINSCNFAS